MLLLKLSYLILYCVLFGGAGGMGRWWRRWHRIDAPDGTVWWLEEDEEGGLLLPSCGALACGVWAEAKRRKQAAEGTASSSGGEGTGGARDTASGREGTTSQQPQQQPIPQQQQPRHGIIYCHGPLNPLPNPQQRQLPQQPPQPKRMPDHNHNNRRKRRAQEYGRSRDGAGGGVLRGVCSEEEEQEEEDEVEDYSYEDDKEVEQDESLMKTRKGKITVMRIMWLVILKLTMWLILRICENEHVVHACCPPNMFKLYYSSSRICAILTCTILFIASLCSWINQEFVEMAELQQWQDKLLNGINAALLGS